MRLTVVIETNLDGFVDEAVMQYPEDVRDTLLSHFDSIQHLIGEADVEWFYGHISDDRSGFRVELCQEDFEKRGN